jgi:thymidine phosphorylase
MLVAIGNESGVKTEAVITDMEKPLGTAVGNALEVIECLEVLKGRGSADLADCCIELAARMLLVGGGASDRDAAIVSVRDAIDSGRALDRFRQIVEGQGGDPKVVDDYSRLPAAPSRHILAAERGGFVTRLDAELIGRASVALGAGRDRVEDPVDPAVGIVLHAGFGSDVRAGDAVLELHYREPAKLEAALVLASRAVTIGDAAPAPRALVVSEVR